MSREASEVSRDDFDRYFPFTPTALAVKECARLTALRRHDCPGPILDVGCGDGLFASIAFSGAEVWGIDIEATVGRWAAASQAYAQVVLGDVTRARLPSGFFRTCIANCSLEHVPRIDLALQNIRDSLQPGGKVYLFVPNREWTRAMLTPRVLAALGATPLADRFCEAVDRVFKHHHLHDEAGWRRIVSDSGLEVEAVDPVLSSGTTVAFEAFLLPSIAGWTNKQLTTRWTNFPRYRRLLFAGPAYTLVRAILSAASDAPTAEFLVVARRGDDGP